MCLYNYAEMARVTGVPVNVSALFLKAVFVHKRAANKGYFAAAAKNKRGRVAFANKHQKGDPKRSRIRWGLCFAARLGLLQAADRHSGLRLALSVDYDGKIEVFT